MRREVNMCYSLQIKNFYRDIASSPPVSDQELGQLLQQMSSKHLGLFNNLAALKELYIYISKYHIPVSIALWYATLFNYYRSVIFKLNRSQMSLNLIFTFWNNTLFKYCNNNRYGCSCGSFDRLKNCHISHASANLAKIYLMKWRFPKHNSFKFDADKPQWKLS